MGAAPSIGVDDDLPAREPRIRFRTSLGEAPRVVNQDAGLIKRPLFSDARGDDVLCDLLTQGLKRDLIAVLGRHYDGVDGHRLPIFVTDAHLALGVGSEVSEPSSAHLGVAAKQSMGERDGERQSLWCLSGGVAEHKPLVSGADLPVAARDLVGDLS